MNTYEIAQNKINKILGVTKTDSRNTFKQNDMNNLSEITRVKLDVHRKILARVTLCIHAKDRIDYKTLLRYTFK